MLRIVILGIDPYGLPFSLCSNVIPNGLLPKAFQKQTLFAFGFFNAPQLSKASFRRCIALKKPITL